MDQQAEKRQNRKSNRTRQKNKRGDSKVESNDSPEILDGGGGGGRGIRHPRPPFGEAFMPRVATSKTIQNAAIPKSGDNLFKYPPKSRVASRHHSGDNLSKHVSENRRTR